MPSNSIGGTVSRVGFGQSIIGDVDLDGNGTPGKGQNELEAQFVS